MEREHGLAAYGRCHVLRLTRTNGTEGQERPPNTHISKTEICTREFAPAAGKTTTFLWVLEEMENAVELKKRGEVRGI